MVLKYNCISMLFYVRHIGFRNEGKRDEKGIESHVVEKRYKDTLIPIIKTSVEKGCKAYSDCWRANNSLKDESFQHYTVNNCQHLKADDGTCTYEIEGVWSLVKLLKIKSMKGVLHEKIESILDEFTY